MQAEVVSLGHKLLKGTSHRLQVFRSTSLIEPDLKGENTAMQKIQLRNGSHESAKFVDKIMESLRTLFNEDGAVLCELVWKCESSRHYLFSPASAKLKKLGLIDERERVAKSVRNVVLSAVRRKGIDIWLDSPIMECTA